MFIRLKKCFFLLDLHVLFCFAGVSGMFSEYIMRAINFVLKQMGINVCFGKTAADEESTLKQPSAPPVNGWIGPKGGLPPVADQAGEIDMEGFNHIQVDF